MRSLVFSCATTVAPPARSGALLSVWSKCQCVLITVFTGAPNPFSDSCSFGHAGATNVSTTTNPRSEEHTSELQSPCNLVCRLLLEKKKKEIYTSRSQQLKMTLR